MAPTTPLPICPGHLIRRDSNNNSMDTGAIVGIVVGVVIAIILIIWAIRSLSSTRQPNTAPAVPPDDDYYHRSSHRDRSRSRHSHRGHHHHHSHSRSRRHSTVIPVVIEKPSAAYVYPETDRGHHRRSRSRSQGRYYTSYQN